MLNGQFNQPRFIADLQKNMQNGFFIECGAADGESLSNTILLEMQYNWTGNSIFYIHCLQIVQTLSYFQYYANIPYCTAFDWLESMLADNQFGQLIVYMTILVQEISLMMCYDNFI